MSLSHSLFAGSLLPCPSELPACHSGLPACARRLAPAIRKLSLAPPQDYARRRAAFGALLIDQPLAQRTLAWLHLHTAGSLALTLETARLLGGWVESGGVHALAGCMRLRKAHSGRLCCVAVECWLWPQPQCTATLQGCWSAARGRRRTPTCCACSPRWPSCSPQRRRWRWPQKVNEFWVRPWSDRRGLPRASLLVTHTPQAGTSAAAAHPVRPLLTRHACSAAARLQASNSSAVRAT